MNGIKEMKDVCIDAESPKRETPLGKEKTKLSL